MTISPTLAISPLLPSTSVISPLPCPETPPTQLNALGEDRVPLAATLSPKPLPSSAEGVASRAFVEGGEATVEWGGAMLHSPKFTGYHAREAEDLDCGDYCAFELYAVPARLASERRAARFL